MARQEAKEDTRKDGDIEEKVLFINRCAKVLKGGRKFSFSALILAGDGKGKIGYGFAKANELTDAIRKGGELARQNLISFEMEGTTVPHEVLADWDGARLLIKPASEGTGIIAGSKVRAVLELAGIKDVVAKSMGSNNPMNQVKCAFKALEMMRNRKQVMESRGLA